MTTRRGVSWPIRWPVRWAAQWRPSVTIATSATLSVTVSGVRTVIAHAVVNVPPIVPTVQYHTPVTMRSSSYGAAMVATASSVDTAHRAIDSVSVEMTVPVVINGIPLTPWCRAAAHAAVTLIQGPGNIRVNPDIAPKWDPDTRTWTTPPPSSIPSPSQPGAEPMQWDARWVVDTLPDPSQFDSGRFALGDPSTQDGTMHLPAAAGQWDPAPESKQWAPAWRSAYPFKPYVISADHHLRDGTVVSHPKAVSFTSYAIEHMWTDFGTEMRQPFTWVMVAMMTSWPGSAQYNYLLDSGRSPSINGVAWQAGSGSSRQVGEPGVSYRSLLAVSERDMLLASSDGIGDVVRLQVSGQMKPVMYIAVFNGAQSRVGVYRPGGARTASGSIADLAGSRHRYYVLGRANGHLSSRYASSMLVFEVRYWKRALSDDDLYAQYQQVSTTYSFDRYRRLP